MSYENREYGMQMEMFNRCAPPDMYRNIGEDSRTGKAWHSGDFDTHEDAVSHANRHNGDFVKIHIYNDEGEKVNHFETFGPQQIY